MNVQFKIDLSVFIISGRRPRLKARATTEGIEMEEYGENDSSEDEFDSGESVENSKVTFQLPKQGSQVG